METAKKLGARVKLIGGWAIQYSSPINNNIDMILMRKPNDIDLIGLSKDKKKIYEVLKSCGYSPDERFNAFNGDSRLLFHKGDILIDVFLDKFSMCQEIDFKDRLNSDLPWISVDDLLLTKIQIVEINEKDIKDIIRLISSHEIIDKGEDYNKINLDYIAGICSDDYGFYMSFKLNMPKILQYLQNLEGDVSSKEQIKNKINIIMDAIEKRPKSLKWKLRAKMGDRIPWYRLPEEKKRN